MMGELCDLRVDCFAEARGGVDTSSDRGSSYGEAIQSSQRMLYQVECVFQLSSIARPLLPYGERSCILQMRAPDLDDVHPLMRLGRDCILERGNGGKETIVEFECGRYMHRRRKRVVRRLRHIHV